jgi:hypothetical protein
MKYVQFKEAKELVPTKANSFRVVIRFRKHRAVAHSGLSAHCLWAGDLNQLQHKSFDSFNFQVSQVQE